MSNIDTQKVAIGSEIAGLGNLPGASFSITVPSQVIALNGAVTYSGSTTITNTNTILEAQIQYSGSSVSDWYLLNGFVLYTQAVPSFSISSRLQFTGGTVTISNFIANNDFAGITIPAMTINVRIFTYAAPF